MNHRIINVVTILATAMCFAENHCSQKALRGKKKKILSIERRFRQDPLYSHAFHQREVLPLVQLAADKIVWEKVPELQYLEELPQDNPLHLIIREAIKRVALTQQSIVQKIILEGSSAYPLLTLLHSTILNAPQYINPHSAITPLGFALITRNEDLVRALVAARADVNPAHYSMQHDGTRKGAHYGVILKQMCNSINARRTNIDRNHVQVFTRMRIL